MAMACSCSAACPIHGSGGDLEQAARKLLEAVDSGSGANVAKTKLRDILLQIDKAKGASR